MFILYTMKKPMVYSILEAHGCVLCTIYIHCTFVKMNLYRLWRGRVGGKVFVMSVILLCIAIYLYQLLISVFTSSNLHITITSKGQKYCLRQSTYIPSIAYSTYTT